MPRLPEFKQLSDSEKCRAFDQLQKLCKDQAKATMGGQGDDAYCDGRQFIYEAVMTATLGEGIFAFLNSYR